MRMEFVKKLREIAGCENVRQFALKMGMDSQQLYRYEQIEHQKNMRMDILCQMRRAAGVSWQELGKMIDKEFGAKK